MYIHVWQIPSISPGCARDGPPSWTATGRCPGPTGRSGVRPKMVDQWRFFCWRFFNGENDEPLALGIPMDALFSGKAIYSCEMLYIYLLDVYGIDLPFSFVGSWIQSLRAPGLGEICRPPSSEAWHRQWSAGCKACSSLGWSQCLVSNATGHWSPKVKNLRRDEVLERQPMLGSRGTIQASWCEGILCFSCKSSDLVYSWCFFRLCGQWRWTARFLEAL